MHPIETKHLVFYDIPCFKLIKQMKEKQDKEGVGMVRRAEPPADPKALVLLKAQLGEPSYKV